MSRHQNSNVATSQLGQYTYEKNTLIFFHSQIKFLKISNLSLLKITLKPKMSNPSSPTLDEVIGNVVEEVLLERVEEV